MRARPDQPYVEAAARKQVERLLESIRIPFGEPACLEPSLLTGDRAWAELDLGVEVRLIR